MENSEQITPEQQIRNQSETIASLTRKAESLERELQKCLDPDKGELRYEFKPASGEARLLAQIEDLQRQLDDCIEVNSDLPATDDLERRIYHAIQGLFLPTKVWSEHYKESREHSVPWWYLREFLFDADLFNDHWADDDFRKGICILNDIVLVLDSSTSGSTIEILERMGDHEFANRLFGRYEDHAQAMHRAIHSLISALIIVRNNQEHPAIKNMVSDSDLVDMLVILRAVAFFQRIWIDAKPEPVKKEVEQEAEGTTN